MDERTPKLRGGETAEPGLRTGTQPVPVIALCSLATFLDGYDIQALGLAVPAIAADFGVEPTAFAVALSGSLVGMAAGAMFLGPLADLWGRRRMLIGLLLLIGVATLGATYATGTASLVVWRVVAGLGMGAIVPVAIAMTAEHAPASRRTALVTLMVACTALGSFAAGIVAPWLQAHFGWRGIFGAGALLPLAAALLMGIALPGAPPRAAVRHSERRATVVSLFSAELRARTSLLWTIFWLNLFVNYSLISWLPTLLGAAGWAPDEAQRATGVMALGGLCGGLLLAWLADRGKSVPALAAAYLGSALLFVLFIFGPEGRSVWLLLLALVGGGAIGAQMALGSLAATYYQPEVRATGIGWSSGMGRVGSILGPLALAALLDHHLPAAVILAMLMVPMLLCAACVTMLPRALRTDG